MPDMKKVKRTELVAFLNITPDTTGSGDYDWAIIGRGMNTGSYAYNPQTTTETWIINDNANTTLDSYQFAFDGEQSCIKGDEVFDFIDNLRYNMATGSDAETQLLLIDKYSVTDGTKFRAQIFNVTISINEFGGDGGVTPTITYTISANGDPKLGTATISAGTPTFTEAEASMLQTNSLDTQNSETDDLTE